MAEGEVHGEGVSRGQISTSLGSFENRGDDLFEDDTGDCCWRGGGSNGKTMYMK